MLCGPMLCLAASVNPELLTGGITEVKTDFFVTSFGPVSDVEMVTCLSAVTGTHVGLLTVGRDELQGLLPNEF